MWVREKQVSRDSGRVRRSLTMKPGARPKPHRSDQHDAQERAIPAGHQVAEKPCCRWKPEKGGRGSKFDRIRRPASIVCSSERVVTIAHRSSPAFTQFCSSTRLPVSFSPELEPSPQSRALKSTAPTFPPLRRSSRTSSTFHAQPCPVPTSRWKLPESNSAKPLSVARHTTTRCSGTQSSTPKSSRFTLSKTSAVSRWLVP